MKKVTKTGAAKSAPMTSKQKQDKRKAEMKAAAQRDGFTTYSAALTAWKNGDAVLVKINSAGA